MIFSDLDSYFAPNRRELCQVKTSFSEGKERCEEITLYSILGHDVLVIR